MAQTKVKLISDGVIVQGNLHASHGITTAHIGEGSNLYYTDARVGSYLSTNSFATESYVGTQIANLVDSSPSALNTLNELAAALGDDANFSTTVTNSIATKMPLAGGTFTGAVVGTSFSAPSGFINGSNGGIRIHSSGTKFFNITGANAARDGVMDIGASDARFKDLYLSGNITAGNATFAGTVQTTQITATNGLNYLKRNTDASLQLRSENTRSGLFITKPATDTVMGSALVLADESYRLGTANHYHMYMLQNGNTYFTQNVGIGTTSPGSKLEVKTSGANSVLELDNSDTNYTLIQYNASGATKGFSGFNAGFMLFGGESGTSTRFQSGGLYAATILTNGNFGIGTTSPARPLHVNGLGVIARFQGSQTGYTQGSIVLHSGTADSPSSRGQGTYRYNEGSDICWYTGTAYADTNKYIWARRTGITSFATDAGEGTAQTGYALMTLVGSSGNVGIGTASPDAKLDLGPAGGIKQYVYSDGGNVRMGFGVDLSGSSRELSIFHPSSNGSNGDISFGHRLESNGTYYEKMRIQGDGKVGIGTTSPNTKLDAHGTTGTKNTTTLTHTSSVYETSVYFTAGTSSTSNHYITTTSVFPPMASGGYILVEVAASGYGSAGSNGFVFKYITGGYGGHYNIPASYHPTEIIADTHTSNCNVAIYYPNSTTIGITVTNNQGTYSITGVMRVKITTTYA